MATRVTLITHDPDNPDDPDHLGKPAITDAQQDPLRAHDTTLPDVDHPLRVSKVKLANDRHDRRAEAEWLWRAARPGIVPIVSPEPTGGWESLSEVGGADAGFTIVTRHVGSRTLRTARLEPEAALPTMIELAELLTELHRDGLVHGKLTPDHVIIGSDRLWLCSPTGTATDPRDDLDGLARCMRDVERQWGDRRRRSPFSSSTFTDGWHDLANRIADGDDPSMSATRAVAGLRQLADGEDHLGRVEDGSASGVVARVLGRLDRGRGVAALGLFLCLAVGGLVVLSGATSEQVDGPRIEVDGVRYAVGRQGDDVVLLEQPCDPRSSVFVLEADDDTVWAFDRVGDGERARAVAVVPGATDLRAEWFGGDESCARLVASGPAGSTIIDPAERTG